MPAQTIFEQSEKDDTLAPATSWLALYADGEVVKDGKLSLSTLAKYIKFDFTTSEQDTLRTWTDDKIVYRQNFDGTSPTSPVTLLSPVDKIITVEGYLEVNGSAVVPVGHSDGGQRVYAYVQSNVLLLGFAGFTSVEAFNVAISYTK